MERGIQNGSFIKEKMRLVGGRVRGEGGWRYEGLKKRSYSMKREGNRARERGSATKAHFIKLRYIAANIDRWRR